MTARHSSSQHTRSIVLFAALVAAFFTYVHQASIVLSDAATFTANTLARATELETARTR